MTRLAAAPTSLTIDRRHRRARHRQGRHRHGRHRPGAARFIAVPLVAVALLGLAACDFQLIVPDGAAPLRYRDTIFSAVTVTSNITYGNAPDAGGNPVALKLDLYEPQGDTLATRPAIVWVHGGGFKSGNKTSAELVDESNTFAKKGFVNVSIDYRLVAGGCAPLQSDCLTGIINAKHDAQAAVRFLRANAAQYRVDPTRIAIGGTSAGAITALNVAYGADDPGTSGNPGYPSYVSAAVSLSGARILTTPDPGEAPALLFHGTADPLVPYQWAVDTVTAAQNAGLVANMTTWDGGGHVPYAQHRTEILDQTTNFLYWFLDLTNAPR